MLPAEFGWLLVPDDDQIFRFDRLAMKPLEMVWFEISVSEGLEQQYHGKSVKIATQHL